MPAGVNANASTASRVADVLHKTLVSGLVAFSCVGFYQVGKGYRNLFSHSASGGNVVKSEEEEPAAAAPQASAPSTAS